MPRRVRVHASFARDLESQVNWLVGHAEPDWLDRLESDVGRVIALVGAYPAAGTAVERRGSIILRRVLMPSTPYLAWYVYDDRARRRDLWLVRLFHSRQRRPRPDPSLWLSDES